MECTRLMCNVVSIVLSLLIGYCSLELNYESYLEGVAVFDVAKAHDRVKLVLEAGSVTFEFLSHLVGDPISTNTLFEELFGPLRMPYRIAPAENGFVCVIYKRFSEPFKKIWETVTKTKQYGLSGVKRKSIVAAQKPRRPVTLRFPNKLDSVGITRTSSTSDA